MFKYRKVVFIFIFLLLLIPLGAKADKVNMYLFYGDGCPHCAEEEEFLNTYLEEEKEVELIKYEVWHSKENQELLVKAQTAINNHASGVPYLIIGNKPVVGYIDGVTDVQIKDLVEKTKSNKKFVDKVKKAINNEKIPDTEEEEDSDDEEVSVPILGKINAKTVSLPLLAFVLGLVDGFNPCAMWILIFLITMLLNMQDRKKMWILGLTFIITSGVVYLAFMLTWLNLANFVGSSSIIKLLVALVSIGIGLFNINKYIQAKKKDDGCTVVDKKERKKIMTTIMNITSQKKFIIALLSIIVLAASVNIIELMCSIGLPVLFTQILSMNDLSFASYMFYIFIYIFFFLIDDIIVFAVAMITFKVSGISTKYSKYSHLVAGIITLIIGLLLLIKPSLLMFN